MKCVCDDNQALLSKVLFQQCSPIKKKPISVTVGVYTNDNINKKPRKNPGLTIITISILFCF